MATNFQLAPPAKVVDGLTAVPIDIQELAATVRFDLATRQAQVTATVQFEVGPTAGCPIFDLRQTIATAMLDGAVVATTDLAHHDFGGGADAQLRVLNRTLAAGSVHTLILTYGLGQPQAPSSQPIGWDLTSPRLTWDLWFSDLWAGRYLEMWFPANLIFDQFAFRLDLELVNTTVAHVVFSNATVRTVGANHWQLAFPARYTALSPMILLGAADRIESRIGTATLPVTGAVTLTTCKLVGTVGDLAAIETEVAGYLAANEAAVGRYLHGNRWTTFLWSNPSRSMEYDGAVTSNADSLRHEVFHSWVARGLKPASQRDGWMDEAWTTYATGGGAAIDPFDLSEPTTALAPANPWRRTTPDASYTVGARFFRGLAALFGVATLQGYLRDFYAAHLDAPCTTAQLEEFLICRSGMIELADYFDHYVYGLAGSPSVDLSLRDAAADPGTGAWGGDFWNSPDVWVRNTDDGSTVPQHPERGQDNWCYARVRNLGAHTAGSFVVTFQMKAWAGTQFVYPADFLPCLAATVGYGLASGETRIVKARWPAALIPPIGTHGCLLVSAYARQDVPPDGLHVWDANSLAQRNVTVVDLIPGDAATVAFHLGNRRIAERAGYVLEIRRPIKRPDLAVALTHADPAALRRLFHSQPAAAITPLRAVPGIRFVTPTTIDVVSGGAARAARFELAAESRLRLDDAPITARGAVPDAALVAEADRLAIGFHPGVTSRLPFALPARSELRVGVTVTAPRVASER